MELLWPERFQHSLSKMSSQCGHDDTDETNRIIQAVECADALDRCTATVCRDSCIPDFLCPYHRHIVYVAASDLFVFLVDTRLCMLVCISYVKYTQVSEL